MTRPSPARSHFERTIAASRSALETPAQQANANAYELMLMKLAEDKRTLKGIQSIERKAEAKKTLLPAYAPWVEGALANAAGVQDDVLMTVMVWSIDVGDLPQALLIGRYAIEHKLVLPDQYQRTTGCLLAEDCADYGLKALADPAGVDAVVLMGTLMAANEITQLEDMPDEVRAKLYKAIGYAARASAANSAGDLSVDVASTALYYLRLALAKHKQVGVKKDIERLETLLKNSAPPPDVTGAAG